MTYKTHYQPQAPEASEQLRSLQEELSLRRMQDALHTALQQHAATLEAQYAALQASYSKTHQLVLTSGS